MAIPLELGRQLPSQLMASQWCRCLIDDNHSRTGAGQANAILIASDGCVCPYRGMRRGETATFAPTRADTGMTFLGRRRENAISISPITCPAYHRRG